jgi:phosphoglycerate dehydrogenase-like enzyme
MSKSDIIVLNVELDRETHKLLGDWSTEERRSMRQQAGKVVAEQVREWLERKAAKHSKRELAKA